VTRLALTPPPAGHEDEAVLAAGTWLDRASFPKAWKRLANPWDDPRSFDRCLAAQDQLPELLSPLLNEIHSVDRNERYWRMLLGPFFLGLVPLVANLEMQIEAASAIGEPLLSWADASSSRAAPRDTAEFQAWLPSDWFNARIAASILRLRGIPFDPVEYPAPDAPRRRQFWKTVALLFLEAGARMRRTALPPDAAYDDLYLDAPGLCALAKDSGILLHPAALKGVRTAYEPDSNDPRRLRLTEPVSRDPLVSRIVSLLPEVFPAVYLEGFAHLRDEVRKRWPRPPRILLTSVGWNVNEAFKMLAAESLASGGKLWISQHGGGYGMQETIENERHERTVADLYLTWGWRDSVPRGKPGGARVVAMPNPRLSSLPEPADVPGNEWILTTCSLPRYPYRWYAANAPISHRFHDYFAAQKKFVETLDASALATLRVRLHASEFGWRNGARLQDRFPSIRFDESRVPWRERMRFARLIAVDHPQTTLLEALAAGIPTVAFWPPEDWAMRPDAAAYFDALRTAGILFDDPAAAAARVLEILSFPSRWTESAAVSNARRRFCDRFARRSPDWEHDWRSLFSSA